MLSFRDKPFTSLLYKTYEEKLDPLPLIHCPWSLYSEEKLGFQPLREKLPGHKVCPRLVTKNSSSTIPVFIKKLFRMPHRMMELMTTSRTTLCFLIAHGFPISHTQFYLRYETYNLVSNILSHQLITKLITADCSVCWVFRMSNSQISWWWVLPTTVIR